LWEPAKARKLRTFLGGSQEASAATRWGDARIEPWDHIQPRMVVEAGQIMVLQVRGEGCSKPEPRGLFASLLGAPDE